MRQAGILLPISSLPSRYGIGTFSKEAYEFVDFLEQSGQTLWQILPLGPTGYGDSPYQSFSTFAGNPYYIDLEELIEKGWLTRRECNAKDFGEDETSVDYEKIYLSRFKLLRKAFERSKIWEDDDFKWFCGENAYWLKDYALYMTVKNIFGGKSWSEWADDIRLRWPPAMEYYYREYEKDIQFYEFLQYMFTHQWFSLKDYANKKGIKIVGDIPIYVAFDSADTWADPKLFQLDEKGMPTGVAGCPPDSFSATGQLWGNPLYRWDYHRNTGYDWWVRRMAYCFKLYDIVRIDHFRGFDEYYSIPYGDKTAENGHWEKGPGLELFQVIKNRLGEKSVIAEDLGFLTDSVIRLVRDTGYPGMKILQFAFDSRESGDYLPHNYTKNTVLYTGTHDNETTMGWYKTLKKEDKALANKYLNVKGGKNFYWDFIRTALASVSDTVVIPMQDYLGLGSEARMNIPSTLGCNWKWRLQKEQLTDELSEKILDMTKTYGRMTR